MNQNDLHKLIYATMRNELAIPTSGIALTDKLSKLNVDTDDWSYLFVPSLQKQLSVDVPIEQWSVADSVEEVANMLLKYINQQ